jgi:glycosyltransferase involved in cell wall biosynthesis
MRIAMVSDTGFSLVSGAARSVERLTILFAQRGHEVLFLTSASKRNQALTAVPRVTFRRFRGVPLPTHADAYFALPFFMPVFQALKKHQTEVVHINETTFLGFSALVAAKTLNLPVVAHSHLQAENILENLGIRTRAISPLINKYLTWFYNDADLVVFPSQFARRLLVNRGLASPAVVISNGVDRSVFHPRPSGPLRRTWEVDKKKVLLYAGRLDPEKHLEEVIHAMPEILRKIPNAHLVLVGKGAEEAVLKKSVAAMKLQRSVTFTGYVTNEDLPKIYGLGDLFVQPSYVELQSMVLLEAMASGLPVLVSSAKDSAAGELVDQNGLTFPPKNPALLARNAIRILTNDSLRKHYADQSLRIAAKHDVTKTAELLEAIDQDLIAEKPRKLFHRLRRRMRRMMIQP